MGKVKYIKSLTALIPEDGAPVIETTGVWGGAELERLFVRISRHVRRNKIIAAQAAAKREVNENSEESKEA